MRDNRHGDAQGLQLKLASQVNTALQLGLMGLTTIHPILPFDLGLPLLGFQSAFSTL